MFSLPASKVIQTTHGKIKKIIIEIDAATITVEYIQGLIKNEIFIPVGTDTIIISGTEFNSLKNKTLLEAYASIENKLQNL